MANFFFKKKTHTHTQMIHSGGEKSAKKQKKKRLSKEIKQGAVRNQNPKVIHIEINEEKE